MDEIIQRYERAATLCTPLWERRVLAYNDRVTEALLESWKDIQTLIKMIQDGASES